MLDGVFGIKQFRNEIVWKRQSGLSQQATRQMAIEHDLIYFYSKTNKYDFDIPRIPLTQEQIQNYKNVDTDGRRYRIRNSDDDRHQKPTYTYLDIHKGVPANSLWINGLQLGSSAKERLGYPTQKPLALYARMIKASSNQHDIVLDPFAGSGTTLDAAHTLGRHWIGIDIGDEAIETIINRMRTRHGLEYDRDYHIRKSPCQQQ